MRFLSLILTLAFIALASSVSRADCPGGVCKLLRPSEPLAKPQSVPLPASVPASHSSPVRAGTVSVNSNRQRQKVRFRCRSHGCGR